MNSLVRKLFKLFIRKPVVKRLVPTGRPGVHIVTREAKSLLPSNDLSTKSSLFESRDIVTPIVFSCLSSLKSVLPQHPPDMSSTRTSDSTVQTTAMATASHLSPPECVRGMRELDRTAFTKTVHIPALRVPLKSMAAIRKKLKHVTLVTPGVKPVAELEESDDQRNSHRLLLLHPDKVGTEADTNEDISAMKEAGVETSSLQTYTLELGYGNWNVTEVLAAIFPDPALRISSFSLVGHIAHLNLKEDVLDFKHLIGQVILDKVPVVKTVVNKLNTIDNTFRNFQMELLAGEENYYTQVRENGCVFEFDFSKVYWNPRLGTEHQHVVNCLRAGDVLYDVFAGVGPFAIPAARRGVTVLANDLNPHSHAALLASLKLNKVKVAPRTFNMDGRDFLTSAVKEDLGTRLAAMMDDPEVTCSSHVVMNLPALALEFLDAFRGLLLDTDVSRVLRGNPVPPAVRQVMPTVHCYGFSKSDDPRGEVRARAEASLGVTLPPDHVVRFVRNVAPNKDMYCLTFRLPLEVALLTPSREDAARPCDQEVDTVGDGDGSARAERSEFKDSDEVDVRQDAKRPKYE